VTEEKRGKKETCRASVIIFLYLVVESIGEGEERGGGTLNRKSLEGKGEGGKEIDVTSNPFYPFPNARHPPIVKKKKRRSA